MRQRVIYTDWRRQQDAERGTMKDLSEDAKEERRRYKREWNRKNPDKVKAAQRRYWERKAQNRQDRQTQDAENCAM